MVCCPQVHRPQTGWNLKVDDANSYSALSHQNTVQKLVTPSLNQYYKTSHYLLQVWTHDFQGISLLWPYLPGKAIKLLFSTSPKPLSLRFDLVPKHRDQVFSISRTCFFFTFCSRISRSMSGQKVLFTIQWNGKKRTITARRNTCGYI